MRVLIFNLTIVTVLFSVVFCNSVAGNEGKKETKIIQSEKVEVYYFHYTRRCVTCTTVENETKAALEELYAEEMKNEKVIFKAFNLDEASSEEIAEKLEISGQTLLVVAGDKKENLTTIAFMNAKSNPEKLREIIKSTIDSFLEK